MEEDKDLEEELFYYDNTSFHKRCDELTNEMSTILKNYGFSNKYWEFCCGNIDKDELVTYVREVLINIDEYARHDLNHLWAMLSEKNCWHVEYDVSQIIHDELMKIWYPEDYK